MPGLRQGMSCPGCARVYWAIMLRRPATFLLALLTATLLAACGVDEGELTLRLVRASFDDPYANLQRYEAWRGKNNSIEAQGPTGADEMRAQMRKRVMLWGAVIGVGAVMIVVGLLA